MSVTRTRIGGIGAAAAMLVLFGLPLAGCRKKQQAPPPPPPEVATMAVHPERVVLTKELPGRTAACKVAEIRPQATGIIQQRLFTEGAVVQAGDVLYRIDPASYEAAYANAKAAVAAAKANHATALAARDVAKASLAAAKAARSRAGAAAAPIRLREKRFRELLAAKAVSQQDYDDVSAALKQAEAGIESADAAVQSANADILRAAAAAQAAQAAIGTAEAGLQIARINLDYTRITAPIAGHIGRSGVTTGALVTANQPAALATIQQLDPIYVDVPQAAADRLGLQQRLADGRLSRDGADQANVRLILENGRPYPLEGKLQFRETTVDPTTGSFILRMVFPNPNGLLLPGMFVRAVIEEGVNEKAVLVPQQAVSRNAKGEPFVLIVDGGTVKQRMIAVDRAIGNRWLVSAGLQEGEQVIVEGLQKARPGAPVKAVALEGGKDGAVAEATDPSSRTN